MKNPNGDLIAEGAAQRWSQTPAAAPKKPVPKLEPRRPYPKLPEPIERFVTVRAKEIGCDRAMLALPTLATLAASIGSSRRVHIDGGEWYEYPILWTAIIGESGTQKSPAFDAATAPLEWHEREAARDYAAAMQEHEGKLTLHEMDVKRAKKVGGAAPPPPAPPVRRRFIVSDATIEAIPPILAENARGLLLARNELNGWIRGFGQYKKGKNSDAQGWMEMHEGRPMHIDRKGAHQYVPRAAVSISGSVQPTTFGKAIGDEHAENGLLARILVAFRNSRGPTGG